MNTPYGQHFGFAMTNMPWGEFFMASPPGVPAGRNDAVQGHGRTRRRPARAKRRSGLRARRHARRFGSHEGLSRSIASFIARRIGMTLLVIVLAVGINFLIPRAMPGDPVEQQLSQLAASSGGNVGDVQAMVASLPGAVRARPAALAAVRRLSGGPRAARSRLLAGELSRARLAEHLRGPAVDAGPARRVDADQLRGRHAARRPAGLAGQRAAGAPRSVCRSSCSRRCPISCSASCCCSSSPWPGRSFRSAAAIPSAPCFDGTGTACAAIAYHAMLPALSIVLASHRHLGDRHARHDRERAGRGLHHARRGQGPVADTHLLCATGCATPCCRSSPSSRSR